MIIIITPFMRLKFQTEYTPEQECRVETAVSKCIIFPKTSSHNSGSVLSFYWKQEKL